jgi:ABC-2 type transport system ATP-binding protein
MFMLNVENLGRREGRVQILENVSFDWPCGVLAVIGGNGTGKTTLLRVIAGAVTPNAGKVLWNGVPTSRAVRQAGKIGYGPQERNLDLAVSLREFLGLCADLRGLRDRSTCTTAVAEELGLSRQLDERLANLSGGGRRKAMTAQALLGRSELIVLDEPTSEVDYSASRGFWAAFQARGKSAALVIATHDVELALRAADSILLLQRGLPARLEPVSCFAIDELSRAIGDG